MEMGQNSPALLGHYSVAKPADSQNISATVTADVILTAKSPVAKESP